MAWFLLYFVRRRSLSGCVGGGYFTAVRNGSEWFPLAWQRKIRDTGSHGFSRLRQRSAHSFCLLLQRKDYTPVLMIRLSRVGARKKPYYRVVVIEKDRARDGRSLEVVGTYNPRTNPATVNLKQDRVDYWTSKGAQLSDRVHKLVLNAAKAAPQAV